ncbi:Uncharacterised protein [Klebsiella pneumoniae]|uniref:hypothetical protein n=1 Tax=Klebsiella pneumoniae TaxID=573 RepID=UPI000808D671|nr:hypothetical protein [Klebsiella pneumoniae]SBY88359.1 Uncharacterised protein [Klebsiella pneumoniae]
MTDITELTQSKSLRKKLNRRLNDAYGFQRTSGGKHTTISLSIAECKSVIAALGEHLALVEALEKAQQRIAELEQKHCGGALMERELAHSEVINKLMSEIDNRDSRIAELESRTVKLPLPSCTYADHSYPAYSKRQVISLLESLGITVVEGDV